jgi:hypothetical protein
VLQVLRLRYLGRALRVRGTAKGWALRVPRYRENCITVIGIPEVSATSSAVPRSCVTVIGIVPVPMTIGRVKESEKVDDDPVAPPCESKPRKYRANFGCIDA